MKRWLWIMLATLALLPACAPSGYYPKTEANYPSVSNVPPAFYDYDPNLRQWYTVPYWNPEASP
jgi:hypothetical protein